MKNKLLLSLIVSLFAVSAWAADDAVLVENFSKVGNVATGTYTWTGDLCTWSVFQTARRAQDTIYDANQKQAIWMSVSNAGSAKVSTTNFEGGIKAVDFKYARYGSEKTAGRVLQLKVSVGDTEYNTPTYANNAMKQGSGGGKEHENYSHAFNIKSNEAQLSIENISTYTETLTASGICRICVGDITITPYLLYTTKLHSIKVGDTYTNAGLINNTEDEGSITYTLEDNDGEASINASTGEVTALADGEVTVKATWSEGVYTTYTLTIVSRTTTTASYTNAAVRIGLGEALPVNALSKTEGYDGTITYASDNDAVAIVNTSTGVVTLQGGVGQVKITATLPQTDDYTAAVASYNLYVRDNDAQIEMFSEVDQTGVVGETMKDFGGDLFAWQAQYQVRRGANDTIHAGAAKHQATSIGIQDPTSTPLSSILQSKEVVEGGIKYLSFYWAQWGAANTTIRRVAVYADEDLIGFDELPANSKTGTESMLAINNAIKANKQLTIKNESYIGSVGNLSNASNASRIVLDNIYITPYLLYTTKAHTLDMKTETSCTYTPEINNIGTEGSISYSLENNDGEASINTSTGEVTGIKAGEVTVKATWSEGAFTTYTLTILAKSVADPSFAESVVRVGLEGPVVNALNKDGHDATAVYASSNTAVADFEAGVLVIKGVGQTTITATLEETENYLAAEASYNLYVRDNGARKEAFKGLTQSGVVGNSLTDLNAGDLFAWQAQYQVRRGTNDTIWNTSTKGISIGINISPSAPSILQSKEVVEGGIKHLSFYWKQWANNSDKTLRMSIYAGSTCMAFDEHASTATPTYEKYLLGANAVMKSNEQLIIKNESYTGEDFEHGTLATDAARIIIDTIYITPYLLYTNKAHELYVGDTYTNTALINNTEGGTITYSLEDNDEEASINTETGEVTAQKAGQVTVKATWSAGAYTTYTLTILSKVVTEASYANAIMRVDLNTLAIVNPLGVTEGYDGEITYTSSNPAVATVGENGNVSLAGGVGQTTITATLPETANFEAATASYILYVRDEQARVEAFTGITGGVPSDADVHDWGGDLFMWQRQYQVRRGGNDTIHAGTDKHQATSIGVSTSPAAPSILQSKEPVEGGIKYLSFYWAQWGAANGCTRRITVYAGDEKIGEQENPNGAEGRTGDEFLLGINNAMKSNKQLIIKNESYKGTVETLADNASRIVLDNIYITPWLLYTDKSERVMRIGDTDKNTSLINNIGADASYESSNPAVASVAADGTVTAVARGKVTITAKYQWTEEEFVTTTYPVTVWPVNCETFDGIEQTNNYSNTTPREGDKATWTTLLGGFNVGDCGALTTNLVRFRAPNNADENAFIESSSIAGGIGAMTFDWNLGGNESTTEWDIRVFINGQLVKTLTNAEISATGAMNHFEQIAIEGINEPGNFVIRFENHSTISGTYPEGNKARFLMDNITWTSYEGTKTLAEDTNNEGWIRANGGQTVDVAISRSPLVANVWNTLCLPFAISKSTDLDGAEVKEMTSVAMEGEVLNIYFSDIEGDELQAGKPYLVKPDADKNISGTYSDKQISSIASPVKNGDVTMQGMFSPVAVTKDDYNTLFVGTPDGEGNNLFYPQADGTLRGLRAYFKIGGAPLSAPRRARYVVTQKDVVTGIESVQNSDVRIQKIIRDGQLFIIHDGKMYNAQGQVIK